MEIKGKEKQDFASAFSVRLANARPRNLTQENVAAEIGVSVQMVSNYERGLNMPSLEKLVAICNLYQVSADDILGIKL